jgi:hypothetical protein
VKPLDKLEIMNVLGISDWTDLKPFMQALGISNLNDEPAAIAAINRQLAGIHPPRSFKQAESKSSALLWLDNLRDAERELRTIWEKEIEQPVTEYLLALVNLGDSNRFKIAKEELRRFRALIPPVYDIASEPDIELIDLRNELRDFWDAVEIERGPTGQTGKFGNNKKVARSLYKWWNRYPLDSEGWWIDWQTGRFFPTQKNFRGTIARILLNKRRRLASCVNCKQYFIKRRDDQKYCLSVACLRQANNQRQQKFQGTKKSAHKKRKGA